MLWLVLRVFLYATVIFDCTCAAHVPNHPNHLRKMPIINNVEQAQNLQYLNGNELRTVVRQKLKDAFHRRFPNCEYNLRAYDIKNWPEGVEPYNSCKWTKPDLLLINERIPYIRFILKETIVEAEYPEKLLRRELEKMKCLKTAVLKKENYKKEMMAMLLARYKKESNQPDAKRIKWNLLDRRNVPTKYNDVPLNGVTVTHRLIFKNPEIIDNIHFYKHDYLVDGIKASQIIRSSSTLRINESGNDNDTGSINNTGSINESVNDDNTVISDVSNDQDSQNVTCRRDLISEIDDEQELDNFVPEFDKSHYGFDIEIDGCDLAKYCEFLEDIDSNNTVLECSMADNTDKGIEKLVRKRKSENNLFHEDGGF